MPDVILFDLFGVIARHQSLAGRRALVEIAGVPAPAFWDVYWRLRMSYDRAEVTGAEHWHQIATELGTTFDADRISALIRADTASWNAVNNDMVALIEQAAASGVRLALLSNAPEELATYYEQHHTRWLQHFELIAFSCRIGHAKPEPEAFRWCCNKLGVTPERILFIDDRTENVHAAQRLGIHTHLFIDPATTAQEINMCRRRVAAPPV
ncbi:HAD family hydrolase [Actinoplanes auranticolor]|uniref:HAD superfamily hydrolase n=1 Tax=Actinoplanes auranticolor TaxID=47988 RepID=A0A919W5L6_9ACTN|nr:HAD family phosphatase [Actinoplanes auranticolor]GIM80713.1 HAD superfamily hydrolase [Actinoplanes auranticolor]